MALRRIGRANGGRRNELGDSLRALYLVAIVVLAGLAGLTVGPGAAAAANTVGDCTTISSSGTYELTDPLTGTQGGEDYCMRIEASDVFFRGAGHSISPGQQQVGQDSVGIYATGAGLTNVTISDVTVQNYHNGTRFDGVDDGTLQQVTVDNDFVGVRLDDSTVTGTDVTIESGPTIDFDATDVLLYQPEPVPAPDGMAVAGQDQFSKVHVESTSGDSSTDLTIRYDPAGLDESSIELHIWDPVSEFWAPLPGATTNQGDDTVSGELSFFATQYAALGDVSESTPTPTPDGPSIDGPIISDPPVLPPSEDETTTTPVETEEEDPDVSFDSSIVTADRGDVATIPLSLTATDTATLTVGSSDDYFETTMTVEDEDGDGAVDVGFNSFALGTSGVTMATATGPDSVSSVDVEYSGPSLLDSGEHSMVVGLQDSGEFQETDVGTLILQEPGSYSMTIRSAPGNSLPGTPTASDLESLQDSGSLVPTETVADGDLLVFEVNVTGVEGLIEGHRDAGDSVTQGFLDARAAGDLTFSMIETAETVELNSQTREPAINTSTLTVVPDYEDGTLYLLYHLSATEGPEPGEAFFSTFARHAGTGTGPISKTWTLEAANVTFDANADIDGDGARDELFVETAQFQRVTGTTTLAAGSQLSISARSMGGLTPFVYPRDVTVSSNGSFEALFDFSDVANGSEFTVRHPESGAEIDGMAVDETPTPTPTPSQTTTTPTTTATTTPTTTATTTPTTTTTTTTTVETSEAETTEADTTEEEEETTGDGQPGFGVLVTLLAMAAALGLARRQR